MVLVSQARRSGILRWVKPSSRRLSHQPGSGAVSQLSTGANSQASGPSVPPARRYLRYWTVSRPTVPTAPASRPAATAASGVSGFFLMRMARLLSWSARGSARRSEGSEAVAEVEFERAAGLQALGEQGSRASLGGVGGDELAEPDGVGADRVRGGHGHLVEHLLGGEHPVGGERGDAAGGAGAERVPGGVGEGAVDPAVPFGRLGVEVVRAEDRFHGPAPSQQPGQVLHAARAGGRADAGLDL